MTSITDTSRDTSPRLSSFRDVTLPRANIEFESFGTVVPTTTPASQLLALLSHWPLVQQDELYGSVINFASPLVQHTPTDEEILELRAAADLASCISTTSIEASVSETEDSWLRSIYSVLLDPLFQVAFPKGRLLSCSQNLTWLNGQDREGILGDPKPNLAFGLLYAGEKDSPISKRSMSKLRDRLTYSPVSKMNVIYPSVILETKSPEEAIIWAENQLAVGAARALSLLAELSSLSALPHQHCVILIATSGSTLKVFVAYQDLGIEKEVVNLICDPCPPTLLTQ